MQKSNRKCRSFAVQDLVWARNFGQGEKWVSGRVFRKLGTVDYEILVDESRTMCHRRIDQLLERSVESENTAGVELTNTDYTDVQAIEPEEGEMWVRLDRKVRR